VFVRIANTGQNLVAGLFAEGRIASETREALTIPALALDERGLQPQVVRLTNGTTERVAVVLGVRDGATGQVEITSGLVAGDSVLVGAALGITIGSRVKVSTPSDTLTQR
jgi:hypothetical protein